MVLKSYLRAARRRSAKNTDIGRKIEFLPFGLFAERAFLYFFSFCLPPSAGEIIKTLSGLRARARTTCVCVCVVFLSLQSTSSARARARVTTDKFIVLNASLRTSIHKAQIVRIGPHDTYVHACIHTHTHTATSHKSTPIFYNPIKRARFNTSDQAAVKLGPQCVWRERARRRVNREQYFIWKYSRRVLSRPKVAKYRMHCRSAINSFSARDSRGGFAFILGERADSSIMFIII